MKMEELLVKTHLRYYSSIINFVEKPKEDEGLWTFRVKAPGSLERTLGKTICLVFAYYIESKEIV
jgi:hypothetical protein